MMNDIKKTGVLTDEQNKKIGEILTDWLPQCGLLE